MKQVTGYIVNAGAYLPKEKSSLQVFIQVGLVGNPEWGADVIFFSFSAKKAAALLKAAGLEDVQSLSRMKAVYQIGKNKKAKFIGLEPRKLYQVTDSPDGVVAIAY